MHKINALVLKFLDSLNDSWEHDIDVLKNNAKIATMDISSLFGNFFSHEETKILRKEIMWDTQWNKFRDPLFKEITPNSDIEFSDESEGICPNCQTLH